VEKPQKGLPPQVRAWVEARKRHRLSHAQVQMARELGLNPGKLGKLSNHRQEPWKAPLLLDSVGGGLYPIYPHDGDQVPFDLVQHS
jgi:hypothetical protein